MGGSYSQTIMQDQRIAVEQADVIAGVESVLTMPRSVAVGASARVGDIIFHEFPLEAQQTIEQLVETVETSQQAQVAALLAQQRAIPEITRTIAQGTASVLPEIGKYLLIAVVVIVVAGKVWR